MRKLNVVFIVFISLVFNGLWFGWYFKVVFLYVVLMFFLVRLLDKLKMFNVFWIFIFCFCLCGFLEFGRELFLINKFIILLNDGYGIIFNVLYCKDYIKMYIVLLCMKGFLKEVWIVVI